MCKKTVRIITITVLMAMILSTTALAVEQRASTHLRRYDATVSTNSYGTVTIEFNVTGRSSMSKIGASSISLYKSDGTYVKTYYPSTYTNMMAYGTDYHSSSVIHIGEAGQQYYAVVTFYAQNSSGSDSATFTTYAG